MPSTPQHELAVERVPVGSLEPFAGNARTHDLPGIVESLRVNGQYRPLVVNRPGRVVLAGNGTLEGAISLDWETIAVSWVDVDDDTARRINLVDNRENDKAGYDNELLAALLDAVPQLEGTGFDEGARNDLLARLEGATDPFAEWADMPEFEQPDLTPAFRCVVSFRSEEDVAGFFDLLGRTRPPAGHRGTSLWWPERDDAPQQSKKNTYVTEPA